MLADRSTDSNVNHLEFVFKTNKIKGDHELWIFSGAPKRLPLNQKLHNEAEL